MLAAIDRLKTVGVAAMYKCVSTKHFEGQLRRLTRLDRDIKSEVGEVIEMLCEGNGLPEAYQNHRLQRRLAGYYECHIRTPMKGQKRSETNDILLVYRIREQSQLLILAEIGSHQDLFYGKNRKGL